MNYSTLQTLTPPATERRTQTVSPLSRSIIHWFSIRRVTQMVAVLVIAFILKYHYSTASVNGLKWILAPTAFLVELVSGVPFVFESHAGYMNADNTFLIAAPCSGINFLIIAFTMLAVGVLWRDRTVQTRWIFMPASLVAAYVSTIIANTVRIDIALQTRSTGLGSSWMNPEEIHRVEGIVVYFSFLLLLFVVSEVVRAGGVNGNTLRRLLIPLAIYYAVTLGIPVLMGAFRLPGFWSHSIFVIVTPSLVMLPLAVCLYAIRFCQQRGVQTHSCLVSNSSNPTLH